MRRPPPSWSERHPRLDQFLCDVACITLTLMLVAWIVLLTADAFGLL